MERKKPFGRPCEYNEEIAQKILERVATHGCGIRKLCSMYDDMPHSETINDWRYKFPEFSGRYLSAREHQAHLLAEETIDIADEIENFAFKDKDGNTRVDAGVIAMQDKKIKSRQWLAAQIQPKFYGARHNSPEQQNPQETLSKIQALVADLNKTNTSEI